MFHFILSFFLFANPCFAAFACCEDTDLKNGTTHIEKCHESSKNENHKDEKQSEPHKNDHCSIHCIHTVALSSANISLPFSLTRSQDFQSKDFLYLGPIVESLKRPPIGV